MNRYNIFIALGFLASLSACDNWPHTPTADEKENQQQEQLVAEASREAGMPSIINFAEKKQVKDLYELRDKMVPTWTYMQGIDGRLICLGQSIGYGIPYAVQYSNPNKLVPERCGQYCGEGPMPQSEPNGLFMPASAEGTWVQMLAPDNTVKPVYIEPRVTISPFKLSGSAVSADCK